MRFAWLLGIILVVFSDISFGQDAEQKTERSNGLSKPSRDFLMVQFTYEGWAKKPDSIKFAGVNRGFNVYLCYDWPIQKTNFSFAAGIGVGSANIYFNNQQLVLTDTGVNGNRVRIINEQFDYKRYKLVTAYLEAPFELRYFGNSENRNKGFKAAIGLRVGTLINAHTKGRRSVEGSKVTDKETSRRFLETWRFSASARVGWGNFTLMGTYNINQLYKVGQGPEVTPYSIGICLTGL